jgi:hypothetical protein
MDKMRREGGAHLVRFLASRRRVCSSEFDGGDVLAYFGDDGGVNDDQHGKGSPMMWLATSTASSCREETRLERLQASSASGEGIYGDLLRRKFGRRCERLRQREKRRKGSKGRCGVLLPRQNSANSSAASAGTAGESEQPGGKI